MPRDGRTIAGPLPGVPDCYVIATHSGITLAPLLGELIADEIVAGEVSTMLEPFRPDRFGGT
jgi:glycine/D-amino acid oxidase-like deaminating enzyme